MNLKTNVNCFIFKKKIGFIFWLNRGSIRKHLKITAIDYKKTWYHLRNPNTKFEAIPVGSVKQIIKISNRVGTG